MALICVDFDHTIVDGQTQNMISEKIRLEKSAGLTGGAGSAGAAAAATTVAAAGADEKHTDFENDWRAQWNLVKNLPPRVGAAQWKAMIEGWIVAGHTVAIVSFNDYPHVIESYLTHNIGLSEATRGKMLFQSGCPAVLKSDDLEAAKLVNKNPHLDEVVAFMKANSIPFDGKVLFIDDTRKNTQDAKEDRDCEVVWANPQNNNFFQEIPDKLTDLLTSNKQYKVPQAGKPAGKFQFPAEGAGTAAMLQQMATSPASPASGVASLSSPSSIALSISSSDEMVVTVSAEPPMVALSEAADEAGVAPVLAMPVPSQLRIVPQSAAGSEILPTSEPDAPVSPNSKNG